jgi:hypothetical protein
MSKCPVHKILDKLKRFAGLPVPFMVKWHEGKPDFRVMDGDACLRCVHEKLCGICGEKLGDTAWWIGGHRRTNIRCSLTPLCTRHVR